MKYFVFFERCGFLYISFLFGGAKKIKYKKKEKKKKERMAQRLIWSDRGSDKKPLF